MGIASLILGLLSKGPRKASAPRKKDKPVARILVVDDHVTVCDVLEEFLRSRGYDAYTALDGPTAIAKVKAVRPHIVLLDIMMPGMGGIETLKEIRKVDPRVGIIMVTAISDEELGKRAIELGAYEYITKPIDFWRLETVLTVKMIDLLG